MYKIMPTKVTCSENYYERTNERPKHKRAVTNKHSKPTGKSYKQDFLIDSGTHRSATTRANQSALHTFFKINNRQLP
jgi:hypothetical protein